MPTIIYFFGKKKKKNYSRPSIWYCNMKIFSNTSLLQHFWILQYLLQYSKYFPICYWYCNIAIYCNLLRVQFNCSEAWQWPMVVVVVGERMVVTRRTAVSSSSIIGGFWYDIMLFVCVFWCLVFVIFVRLRFYDDEREWIISNVFLFVSNWSIQISIDYRLLLFYKIVYKSRVVQYRMDWPKEPIGVSNGMFTV